MFKYINFKMLVPYFLLAVSVLIAYYAISEITAILNFIGGIIARIWGIIRPFFYGFILAYILHIPFHGMQELIGKCKWKFIKKRKKAISLIITFLIIIMIIFLVLYLIIPSIYSSILVFINNLPDYYASALSWLEYVNNLGIVDLDAVIAALEPAPPPEGDETDITETGVEGEVEGEVEIDTTDEKISETVPSGFNINLDGIIKMIEEWAYEMFSFEQFSSAVFGVGSALVGLGSALFTGFLVLISSVFYLIEKDKIKHMLRRLLMIFTSIKVHDIIIKYGGKFDKNCKQYIKTQTVFAFIFSIAATISLLIMRSPFALILGIFLGVANYIPYFGSIVATIVAVVVIAFTQGLTVAVIAFIVILIMQQLGANVLQPKLLGDSFSLSPLLILVGIIVGGALAGIFGMVVAIPIIAILKDILEDIVKSYEQHKLKKAAEPPPPATEEESV